jgi:hypothetical protein
MPLLLFRGQSMSGMYVLYNCSEIISFEFYSVLLIVRINRNFVNNHCVTRRKYLRSSPIMINYENTKKD